MSNTTSRGLQETDKREERENTVTASRPGGTRRRWIAIVVLVVIGGAGAGGAWFARAVRPPGSSGGNASAAPPQTATVTRQNISSSTPESATLGYAASYTVSGQGGGTVTELPQVGSVISQGQALYETNNGVPTVLMYGSVPAWRSLSEGITGEDVTQLNHDVVDLGYASRSVISALGWDTYSWETRYAVAQLQKALGESSPSGSLSLGSVVFEPEALRISRLSAILGGPASGAIMSATSDRHVVTINLSTDMESEVKAGDAVKVALPDGSTTAGVVTSVGTVASGSSTSATVPVSVQLNDPSAAGSLDQAPVTVYITTASASNVLVVPVGALQAQPSGGYAVEVEGPGNTRRWVRVTVGPIFDDTSGLVEVTGDLMPGERVVVPNI